MVEENPNPRTGRGPNENPNYNPYGATPPIQPAPSQPAVPPPGAPAGTGYGYPAMHFHTMKNSVLSTILSLIIPGLGQFYIGAIYEGMAFLVVWAIGWAIFFVGAFYSNGFVVIGGMIIAFITAIAAAAFAYQRTQEYNNSILTTGEPPKWATAA